MGEGRPVGVQPDKVLKRGARRREARALYLSAMDSDKSWAGQQGGLGA